MFLGQLSTIWISLSPKQGCRPVWKICGVANIWLVHIKKICGFANFRVCDLQTRLKIFDSGMSKRICEFAICRQKIRDLCAYLWFYHDITLVLIISVMVNSSHLPGPFTHPPLLTMVSLCGVLASALITAPLIGNTGTAGGMVTGQVRPFQWH